MSLSSRLTGGGGGSSPAAGLSLAQICETGELLLSLLDRLVADTDQLRTVLAAFSEHQKPMTASSLVGLGQILSGLERFCTLIRSLIRNNLLI